MTDTIFSPDGKFMWTGSEWDCAPPSLSQSTNVNLNDSVIGGDINITQNNAEDIASAMVQALERLGFSGQSTPSELSYSGKRGCTGHEFLKNFQPMELKSTRGLR